ncbi:protease inhibitors-like [Penaeus japonicus]|uniref:protease inhibitors-like n=1 Tax=Penaeus japonicus TaxID=27405 RepID=UPI001C714FE4|nr:protease inhibitors-like [Penaeus japonicus]
MKVLCLLLLAGLALVESSALHPRCKEGETITDDCNTCQCVNGHFLCTLIDCSEVCTEGEVVQQDCNTCTCRNGNLECTEIACAPGYYG